MKLVFEKGNAGWICELSSNTKSDNNSNQQSTKKTPVQDSQKINKKTVFSNLQDKREKRALKYKVGDVVGITGIRYSLEDTIQLIAKIYIQKKKSSVIQFPNIEQTFHLKEALKVY